MDVAIMVFVIEQALAGDFEQIWPIFQAVVAAGETYVYAPDTSYEQAYALWMQAPLHTYVARQDGRVVGTYYLKANQSGLGDHVANCGYMVDPMARGQGVATLLGQHSLQQAKRLGFLAMQFNFVVETNQVAVQLWQKLGFAIVGRVPKAFRHQVLGFVDVLILHRALE